ncbi:hypothetical protein T492DRAFT_412202 [Pavlovales sp. CCMP2436]|nr:hypothetical protein T492DRAFT_412202 [Pavlovales sp. CCMP2436]
MIGTAVLKLPPPLQLKFRLFEPKTKAVRSTLLAPAHGGAITSLALVPTEPVILCVIGGGNAQVGWREGGGAHLQIDIIHLLRAITSLALVSTEPVVKKKLCIVLLRAIISPIPVSTELSITLCVTL